MEGFLEAITGGAVWGLGFGLALGVVRSGGGIVRPLAKGAIKGTLAATDWARTAAEESRETLQDLYHETKAERAAHEASA